MQLAGDRKIRIVNAESVKLYEFSHGSAVFLVPSAVTWVKTSATGAWIYRRLAQSPMTVGELVREVADNHDLPVSVVEPPTRELLAALCDRGLATQEEAVPGIKIPLTIESRALQQLWINVTNTCNLRCPHCYVPGLNQGRRHLPVHLARKVIGEARDLGVRSICVAGEEPGMHPELREILECARGEGVSAVKVVTNGVLDPGLYEQNVLPFVHDLQVSLDGVDAKTHDGVRGPGTFQQIVKLFHMIRQRHGDISRGISFVPLSQNIEQMPLLFNLALRLGANYIHLNRPKPPGLAEGRSADPAGAFWCSEAFEACLQEYDELMVRLWREKETSAGLAPHTPIPYVDTSFDPSSVLHRRMAAPRCSAGILTICLDENGDYYPCAALCRRVEPAGNAAVVTLAEARRRAVESMQALFNVDRDQACRACDFRYYCGGGCRATATDLRSRDAACAVLKRRFEGALGRIVAPRAEPARDGQFRIDGAGADKSEEA